MSDYQQYCALARTLDVVGDRWTMLIMRELLLGPKRFGELLDAKRRARMLDEGIEIITHV